MDAKQSKFESVIKNRFTIESFVDFTNNFMNNLEIIAPYKFNEEFSNFSYYIAGNNHIANYLGNDNKKVAVFAVKINIGDAIERARSMQRNYVKRLIENGNCDGAIVAFYTDDLDKWRLSFVKLDYEFAGGKVTEKITPAKRYSYLVGAGEPCHTAMERLYPIFANETSNPNIAEIEEAFSVETVTKHFFEDYKAKYYDLKEHLERNPDFVSEATRLNFTSEQFAKKLMGQLAFLYFIQKKGWLGVNAFPKTLTAQEYKQAFHRCGNASRDVVPKAFRQVADDEYRRDAASLDSLSKNEQETLALAVKGQPWGTGPKNFIRKLFEVCDDKGKDDFFDEYLEPLFYEALNEKRGANDYYHKLNCRVPFLNGGLFEPLDNYDWSNNKFDIPNIIFSDKKIKGAYNATGILDVFDRYNFTMNEDEPLEKEVAVDPEMLGKIFENLLDAKDRKSKGAFYTPREIVHYMCQESLVNYLVNETGISCDAIKEFIVYGEFMRDEDTAKEAKQELCNLKISAEILDTRNNINRLKDIDDALADIRVADPAVGSGAFPLGMISEIVKARRNLTEYFGLFLNVYQKQMLHNVDRHPLKLKLHTIKNSIFAVDIEPSAVDITKLRLWLSLVVEQETNENANDDGIEAVTKNPRPLPNLDCNIRCGNSLIDELDGVKLINESELFGGNNQYQTTVFHIDKYETLLEELFKTQDKLFYESNHQNKEALQNKIRAIIDRIVMISLEDANPETIEKYNKSKTVASLPYFLWQLEFAKVFKEKGGFDVVIGNPPYIQLQKDGGFLANQLEPINFETFERSSDIYCLFYEQGNRLLHNDGSLCFITSNKWMRAKYGTLLRKYLAENTQPLLLIDLGANIFETAMVDTNILLFEKKSKNSKMKVGIFNKNKISISTIRDHRFDEMEIPKNGNAFTILNSNHKNLEEKIKNIGVPLEKWDLSINYGIKTGFNEAFIVNEETKNELIAQHPKSAEILKPVFRGKDIKRYSAKWAGLWLINTHNGYSNNGKQIPPIEIEKYPAIKEYLNRYYTKIANRTDKGVTLYNLRSCAYLADFEQSKIIYPETTQGAYFYLDTKGSYVDKTCFMINSSQSKYLVSILSSKLFEYAYRNIFSSIALGETAYQYNKHALLKLPIAQLDKTEEFDCIVDEILSIKQENTDADTSMLEKQIDKMVYKLYSLTDEEIEIVEASVK